MLPWNGRASPAQRKRANRPFRAAMMTISILTAAGCAGMKPVSPPPAIVEQDPVSITRFALRDMLLSPGEKRDADVLAFYKARDYRPAWTANADAQSARAVLTRAHEQGLSDKDYALPGDGPAAPGAKLAQRDIAFSDAVLRYARQVRAGRINPDAVYNDVSVPPPAFDAAQGLDGALKNATLDRFLAGLPPPHPEYRALVAALARYRAIAEKGGWPSLPGETEIKLDGKDPQRVALVQRLSFEDPVLAAMPNPAVAALRDAVKRFQARNGLDEDGRVRGATLAALNLTAAARADEIAANMERWRWLPPTFERRYVAVNVPDQSVQFVRDGESILRSRVIVGRKTSGTPITRSEIVAVVVNPPWNIPGDIAARDLLPQLKKNSNFLAANHMVVTDGLPGDPYGRKIDWKKIVPANFPYAIRQLPGSNTALGTVMLDSPNDFDVYLHDTPNKKRFEESDREISNGCVRVQQIFPLASLALSDDMSGAVAMLNQTVKTGETKRLPLEKPLPVYFLYWTAIADADGNVQFRPDLYGRDGPLIAALNKTKVKLPVPVSRDGEMPMDELSP